MRYDLWGLDTKFLNWELYALVKLWNIALHCQICNTLWWWISIVIFLKECVFFFSPPPFWTTWKMAKIELFGFSVLGQELSLVRISSKLLHWKLCSCVWYNAWQLPDSNSWKCCEKSHFWNRFVSGKIVMIAANSWIWSYAFVL